MENQIPITQLDSPIIDATQHNPAIRLAKGRFQLWRRASAGPLVVLFLLAPWLTINDAPWLWMNLEARELHFLGLTLWPDDLLVLTWLAFGAAFALFSAATVAGRLWCGFACPQTVWSMMFTWVEEKTQGSRNKRLKELKMPWYRRRLLPLFLKHFFWLLISFVTGFTFVAFFETGSGLASRITQGDMDVALLFWLIFFTALTYINGGWLREQVCLHMCPYSRFQSVMLDKKSLKVSYDTTRGEPRKKGGDCVDCNLCVQVCPVGIDIRHGLQYACIDCAACIDVCDDVMNKVGRETGLIRFAHESKGGNRLLNLLKGRSKLWGYLSLTLLAGATFFWQVLHTETLDTHFSRDRGQLYFYNGNGELANGFALKLHNKTELTQTYQLKPEQSALSINGPTSITLSRGESRSVSIELQCDFPCGLKHTSNIGLSINNPATGQQWVVENRFFVGG